MSEAILDVSRFESDEALRLENQLCFPLYVCSKEVVRRYAPLLDQLNLTYTQYLVMLALWEYGSMSVGEMGERLYLDSGTLTPLLKKLETKGLLIRLRSDSDARRVDVALTDAGRALKEQAQKVPAQMGSCVGISPDEGATLIRLLHKVIDAVGSSY